MKKILSLILTLAMVFSLAVPAMAAEPTVNGNTSGNVTASYTPTTVTYTVTVKTAGNGTVNADKSTAAEGNTVTLTVTPNSGYELDNLTVSDGTSTIETTKVNDTTYTFNMPAVAVTVTATFKVVVQKYKIEISTATKNGTVSAGVETAGAGDEVQLTAIPDKGYELRSVVVSYTVPNGNGSKEMYVKVNDDLTFTMPAYDVRVEGYFDPVVIEPKITSLYVTIDGVKYDSTNTSAENPATIYSDSTYKVIVTGTDFDKLDMTAATNNPSVQYARGYAAFVNSDWSVDASSNTATFTISSMRDTSTAFEISYANKEDSISGTSNRNYHGSGVYIVYVNSAKPVYYNVNIAQDILNGKVTANPTSATAGATVTLTVAPESGYELDTLSINDDTITATEGEDGMYTFTMPAGNVTVNATFKKINYTITVNPSETGSVTGSVTAPATATMGDSVTLTVTPNTGYQIGTVTVKDGLGNTVDFTETGVASGTYIFTMPASDVTVTATFNKLPITSADISWGSMAFTYTDGKDGAEGAWTNDGSEGAGTVTVKNTGDNTFTAQVAYTAVTEYDEIEGTFDATSAELITEASKTFTLTLKNKPEKAITAGTKIGEVTITINEAAED